MSRQTQHRRFGRVRLLASVLATLLTIALFPFVGAGASPGVFGGFEIDGDLQAGTDADWSTANPIAAITDKKQGEGDDGFKGGSKEQEPDGWVFGTDNNPPNKDDLVRGYVSQRLIGSELFLYTSFRRTSNNGNVHIDFEFNQDDTFVNSQGTTVVRRLPGDLLVTYDGTNAGLDIRVWRWSGTERSGTWVLLPSTAGLDWDAALNTSTVSDPLDGGATAVDGTFGEAALNLTRLGIALSCPGFGTTWMKTRASESITAELKDKTNSVPVDLSNCGKVIVHKTDDGNPPAPLAGAVFGLFGDAAASGAPVQTATTVADGSATFDDVTPGTYWVKEISAPAGYVASTQIVQVTVGIRETVDVATPFVDPREVGSIRITKRAGDAAGPPVAGVRFTILQGGVQARTWPDGDPAGCTTDASGTCTVSKLLLGTYTVHEDPATVPDSQFPAPDQTVTINGHGQVVDVLFVNPLRPIAITVQKTATPVVHVGDTIGYEIVVRNPSDTIPLDVAVADTECTGPTGPTGDDGDGLLDPAGTEAWTYTCSHVATAADGASYTNHVHAEGTDAFGRTVTADALATTRIIHPAISIDKKVGGADHATAGDALVVHQGDLADYTVVVTNTGDTDLTISGLTDSLHADLGASCDRGNGTVLPPGGTISCAYTDSVGADASNVASVTGTDELGGAKGTVTASDQTFVDVIHPEIEVTKTVDRPTVHAGDGVTYTYVVRNSGDVPLSGVTLSDDKLGAVGSAASLAAGASRTFTAAATITVDTTNVVTATGVDPLGATVADTDDAVVDVIAPDVRIVKTVSDGTVHAGDLVGYTYVVTNTGDVTLTAVTVVDDILGPIASGGVLGAGASATYTRGGVPILGTTTNIGTVTGTDPLGLTVTDADDAKVTVIDPRITLEKSGPAQAHEGDGVTYTFRVANTGDTPLSGVQVTDAGIGVTLTVPDLAPGASQTVSAPFTIPAGAADPYLNNATACGTDGLGRSACGSDTHTIDLLHPAVTLDKKVNDGDHKPAGQALLGHTGDALSYTVVATNTGDTPLEITALTDSLNAGLAAACDEGVGDVLAVGANVRCSYADTAGSDDAHNVASITGTDALGGPKGTVSAGDETFVDVIHPAIALVKTVDKAMIHTGERVAYTYLVTNTGDTPLDGVTVSDDKLGVVGTLPGTLQPAASGTLTAATNIDVDTTNVGTASGRDVLGRTVTASDDAVVDVISPDIGIEKTVSESTVHIGDAVDYTYVVRNTGDVPLTGVTVTDDILGSIGSVPGTLTAGASQTLVRTGVAITSTTTNIGTATGVDPLGRSVSAQDDAKVTIIDPKILLEKTGTATAHEGDTITYTFTVTNTGDSLVTNLELTDPVLGLTVAVLPLGTGQKTTFARTFVVPAGAPDPLVNNAQVCGVDLLGSAVCSADTHTVDILHPSISVTKDGPATAHRGDVVTYTLRVTNTSTDTPLTGVRLTDPVTGTDVSVGDLAFGASRTVLVEFRIPAEASTPFPNTAEACGTDPLDAKVCDQDDHRIVLIRPAIAVTKVAVPTTASVGQTVTFTYVVTNTGDTTLNAVTLADDVLGAVGGLDGLEPGGSRTFTKTQVVTPTTPATNIVDACGRDALGLQVCAQARATITVVAGVQITLPATGRQIARLVALGFLLLAAGLQLSAHRPRPVRGT